MSDLAFGLNWVTSPAIGRPCGDEEKYPEKCGDDTDSGPLSPYVRNIDEQGGKTNYRGPRELLEKSNETGFNFGHDGQNYHVWHDSDPSGQQFPDFDSARNFYDQSATPRLNWAV